MKNEMDKTYIEQLANYIGPMIKDGIAFDDEVINFTMLDYYCITKMDIHNIIGFIRPKDGYDNRNPYYSFIAGFIEKESLLVREIDNPMDIFKQRNAFIINGKRFEPTLNDIQEIFNLFDQYNIPKFNKLIYIALYRIARNDPILPLISLQEEKNKTR